MINRKTRQTVIDVQEATARADWVQRGVEGLCLSCIFCGDETEYCENCELTATKYAPRKPEP